MVKIRICKYCNDIVTSKKGLVCYKCRYDIDKEYQLNKRLQRKKEKDKEYRDKVSLEYKESQFNRTTKQCFLWVEQQYKNKLMCDIRTILVDMIDIYYILGGKDNEILLLSSGEQLQEMWYFIDEKYKNRKNDFLILIYKPRT